MSKYTVKALAEAIKITPAALQSKLKELGINIQDPNQVLSDEEQDKIFRYHLKQTAHSKTKTSTSTLNLQQGRKKVTITRKSKILTVPPVLEAVGEEVISTEMVSSPPQETQLDHAQASISTSTVLDMPEQHSDHEKQQKKQTKLDEETSYKKPKLLSKESKKRNQFLLEEDTQEETLSTDSPLHASSSFGPKKKQSNQGRKSRQQAFKKPVKPFIREILIPESVAVIALAQKMSVKVNEIIKKLTKLGMQTNIHQDSVIDQDTATLLVEEMGHVAKPVLANHAELDLQASIDKSYGPALFKPPVVTIMGHVDHGKTTLLDYIRQTKLAAQEAGGITQHIGAYHIEHSKGTITFLDTPGHSAFTSMRARGANLTDIVILIVAADDGVMPQTKEALEHAQAAKVPIVVAINKIDQVKSNIERIQQELSQYGLTPEAWGGDAPFVLISAKTGVGIDELLDTLLVQAEMLELKAPREGPAEGVIIEARLDKGQGCIATMLVKRGTLKKGDILIAGTAFGRVRALRNEQGKLIQAAGPSMPIEILGLSSLPLAGDQARVVDSERTARSITQNKTSAERVSKLQPASSQNGFDFLQELNNASNKIFNIVFKADVQGSAEAIQEALTKLSNDEITLKLLVAGVGSITESDVNLAIASKAMIFGFNVRPDAKAKQLALQENIAINYHTIIYELLDQVKQTMGGLLGPQVKEMLMGKAVIREIFNSAKKVSIAGCYITEGTIQIKNLIRVLRNNRVIHEGELHSLRRFKDTVNEVREGTECGIGLKNYSDLRKDDIIESYERIMLDRVFD